MQLDPDYLRLQKIIKSSKRVENLRHSFGLKPTEYVVTFDNDQTKISNGKTTTLKKLTTAEADMRHYARDLLQKVQREVVDYFRLKLDAKIVRDAIFMRSQYVPPSFWVFPSISKKTGYAKITIELYEIPNPETREYLWQEILNTVQFFRNFHVTKNTKGLRTAMPVHFKADKINRFDEKFEITKRYRDLRQRYAGKQVPAAEMDVLCFDARRLLNIGSTPKAEGIRKIADNFEKAFEPLP